MADVIFEDYSIKVQGAIEDKINAVLEECAGELESAAKRNTRVDTGKTKNSWRHEVDTTLHEATIGSSDENAIWEEFGTGEYALKGNGRKGGWWYRNPKATFNKDGSVRKNSKAKGYVFTLGKKPSRAFQKAYDDKKDKIINHIQNSFKGL